MKKLLLVLSVAMCSVAHAEWTHVATGADHTVYIDKASVKSKGSHVSAWTLRDHMAVQSYNGKPYWSDKVFMDFDCKQDTLAMQYLVVMTEKMGTGLPLDMLDFSDKPSRPVVPQSVLQTVEKVLCSMR
jgi:hypothetical protein